MSLQSEPFTGHAGHGATYNGFARQPAPRPRLQIPQRLRRPLMAGAAAALAVGAGLGMWASPGRRIEPTPIPAGQVDIVVRPTPPEPVIPAARGPRLEVLPPDMAAAAPRAAPRAPLVRAVAVDPAPVEVWSDPAPTAEPAPRDEAPAHAAFEAPPAEPWTYEEPGPAGY